MNSRTVNRSESEQRNVQIRTVDEGGALRQQCDDDALPLGFERFAGLAL
jgi:hypothetical protein